MFAEVHHLGAGVGLLGLVRKGDGVEFANQSLERGLAVAPGEGFGNYKNFIRISACQDEKTLMEGMHILGNIMSEKQ